jgi:hypothetical protein
MIRIGQHTHNYSAMILSSGMYSASMRYRASKTPSAVANGAGTQGTQSPTKTAQTSRKSAKPPPPSTKPSPKQRKKKSTIVADDAKSLSRLGRLKGGQGAHANTQQPRTAVRAHQVAIPAERCAQSLAQVQPKDEQGTAKTFEDVAWSNTQPLKTSQQASATSPHGLTNKAPPDAHRLQLQLENAESALKDSTVGDSSRPRMLSKDEEVAARATHNEAWTEETRQRKALREQEDRRKRNDAIEAEQILQVSHVDASETERRILKGLEQRRLEKLKNAAVTPSTVLSHALADLSSDFRKDEKLMPADIGQQILEMEKKKQHHTSHNITVPQQSSGEKERQTRLAHAVATERSHTLAELDHQRRMLNPEVEQRKNAFEEMEEKRQSSGIKQYEALFSGRSKGLWW